VSDAETVVLTGMTWAGGSPALRVRRNGAPSVLEPLAGFALQYSTGPEAVRHCVGHKPFRDTSTPWMDCDRLPLHDGRTCDRCAASNATFASQLHHAHNKGASELDSAVRAHLDQPNHLYLAAFRDGSIKVGTSTAPRLSTRLDEQGAWTANIVADARDGFAVRTLEDRVTVELGLPQSVSVVRKLDGLVHPQPLTQLREELGHWTKNVTQLIERSSDERIEASDATWTFAGHDDPLFEGLHPYPLKLESGNHDLEFLGASGRVAVLQRPGTNDRFVVDVRKLYGIELTLGHVVPDELAVQDSLF
jgi:hypothetical protein